MASENVPVNKTLYARVKAAAKRKFAVYPSAYANAWLVRRYKALGGTYEKAPSGGTKKPRKPAKQKSQVRAVAAWADGLTRNGSI